MEKNTKIRVLPTAPFHGGETHYFQFMGEGKSAGVVVLSPEQDGKQLIAVHQKHIEIIDSQKE